jgi:hypothetical protein
MSKKLFGICPETSKIDNNGENWSLKVIDRKYNKF